MKKILISFACGILVALIAYVIWAIYAIRSVESNLPPRIRDAEHPFIEANKILTQGSEYYKNGNIKEGCLNYHRALKIYRMAAQTKEEIEYVAEVRAKINSVCKY